MFLIKKIRICSEMPIICGDVVLDVFSFSKRRQLALLELIGRRFQRIIEIWFAESPRLVFNKKLVCHFRLRAITENEDFGVIVRGIDNEEVWK